MRRAFTLSVSVAVLAAIGLAAFGALRPGAGEADRADCPGKIVCPQTGELICRDKCPTVDPNRPDCPGRIICPKTGELICVDRCPLKTAAQPKPSCCPPGK